MRDDTKQQAEPIPPPMFPFAAPARWNNAPDGTYNGLGLTPAPAESDRGKGDARRTPPPPVAKQ